MRTSSFFGKILWDQIQRAISGLQAAKSALSTYTKARGRIPEDQQRLVLRYEDAVVRQALERDMNRDAIADLLGFSRRTTFYKEKRAYAYDFPLEAFQTGRRGWTGGDDETKNDEAEAEKAEDRVKDAVDRDDEGEVQVWSTVESNESVTAAKLLDDVEDVAEEKTYAKEDENTPETHLERAISALQATKSAL